MSQPQRQMCNICPGAQVGYNQTAYNTRQQLRYGGGKPGSQQERTGHKAVTSLHNNSTTPRTHTLRTHLQTYRCTHTCTHTHTNCEPCLQASSAWEVWWHHHQKGAGITSPNPAQLITHIWGRLPIKNEFNMRACEP